ncbi:MAG: succinate dehydrogenase [Anaerolineae bacterium]|nr:succinate dehydrogenase [Anaerolineae bacterium]MCO5206775.1 succinate dehydrogenase [Anaerolineae bacterium]
MATTISNTDSRTIRNVRVKANFERTAFMFMRSSGIILVILAVGHVMLQLIFNNVHYLSVEFVAEQWSSWGWKVYDMALLVFALTHGINGFRNVLEDYIHNRGAMKVINILLVIFLVVSIVWAGYAIASADPAAMDAAALGL